MKKTLGILAISMALVACAPHYSDGSRVGVVTKLSRSGLVFKSWEGSMNQGGTKTITTDDGNRTVTNAFDFNASDSKVIAQLQEAMKTGKPVELVYSQWYLKPFTISNSRVIVEVKPVQ